MRSGDLIERISLEEITGTGDGAWTPRAASPTLRAAVEWLGTNGTARIRIRYRDDLKSKRDLGRGLRLLFEGHVLMIDDVTEVVRGREVHLACHDEIAEAPVLATGAKGVVGA